MIQSLFFFFKQKTAYEMRISDWSSDVCSSDLDHLIHAQPEGAHGDAGQHAQKQGRDAGGDQPAPVERKASDERDRRQAEEDALAAEVIPGRVKEIGRASGREGGCTYV